MKTKTKKIDVKYEASIKVLGKVYKALGTSAREAIENLKPAKGQGVAILTVSKDGVSKDRVLPAPRTLRLFSRSPLMREIALKQTAALFNL